jgi:hypothetical protein
MPTDLRRCTGLEIKPVDIGKVNFLRDIVNLKVYSDDPTRGDWSDCAGSVSALDEGGHGGEE